jgi:hypothetical protein
MRHFILAVLLACALPAPVQAQGRQPNSAQLQDFAGQYTLQDGRTLTVTQRQRALAAQLDGRDAVIRDPVKLAPVGPATFATPDGQLRVTFDQRPNGNVAAVTVVEQAPQDRQAGR